MKVEKPLAMMLDLDDTIVAFSSLAGKCWNNVMEEFSVEINGVGEERLLSQIQVESDKFWLDQERARVHRQDMEGARRRIVREAFAKLELHAPELADRIADRYSTVREEAIYPFPGAIDTIRSFRESDFRLALVTNGSSASQRRKIDRFGLSQFFDHILIEGELGYGKPDERVYMKALSSLGTAPNETWMIGDNPLWDVTAPQKLGIRGIWVNSRNSMEKPLPAPFLTVRTLQELLDYL